MQRNWKRSFTFLINEMMKFKNLKSQALKAFKNSLFVFSRGNVSEEHLRELSEILGQIMTTDDLKHVALEERNSNPGLFETWTDVPYWSERNPNNTIHVVLWEEKTVDGINGNLNKHDSEEAAWNVVSSQLQNWVDAA